MSHARKALTRRERKFLLMRDKAAAELLIQATAFERDVLAEFGKGFAKLETSRDLLKWSKANGAAVQGTLKAIEGLGYGALAVPMKEWARKHVPQAYAEGLKDRGIFVSIMGGKRVPMALTEQDTVTLRAALTDAYKFANKVPAETSAYYRATFTRSLGERWTKKKLAKNLIKDGRLTSLVDKAGREISVKQRAEMFANWHVNSTHNIAQRAKDTETYGEDPLEIWDAVLDSHTSQITFERVGKVFRRSEWDKMGGNVFDGSGHPPLWPGCRCRTRAVERAWFEPDEWEQLERGEPLLFGEDQSEYMRHLAVAA